VSDDERPPFEIALGVFNPRGLTKLVVTLDEPTIITDPNQLRLTVDPAPSDIERFGKPLTTMKIIYARQPFPQEVTSSIFLAGPTPRDKENVPSWRPEALKLLASAGFDGHVFVPETEEGAFNDWEGTFPYKEQVEWEEEALHRADCILFWIPREMDTMPGLTTNDEYGFWKTSGKVVLGTPPDAEKVRYQRYYAEKVGTPVLDSLEATCAIAVARVMPGVPRVAGETAIPQLVWKTPSFQAWYDNLKAAGNRLDGGRVLWNFRVGPKKSVVFSWVLHANIHITKEGRNKVNEFVLSRSDVSTVCMFYMEGKSHIHDVEVVLVKEFRSPVSNAAGYVVELPGGSADPNDDAKTKDNAVKEVQEETGFSFEAERLMEVSTRQVAATLSTHKAQLYALKLTGEEIEYFRGIAGKVFGNEADSERCYPQVLTVGQMLVSDGCDWTTIGQILSTITGSP
jgi:8-oxo-dGTP pyrophosphatase MutT (NUDIX family)